MIKVVTWNGLSKQEREAVTFAYGESKGDYSTYQVRYNSKGVLLGVRPYGYSRVKKDRINGLNNKLSVVDYCVLTDIRESISEYKKTYRKLKRISKIC